MYKEVSKKIRDNTNCCVPQCNSRGSRNPELSFHAFPSEVKELNRRRRWILALRIGKPVSTRMVVCSKHFLPTDYTLPYYVRQRPRLKRTAIPSQHLPVPVTDERSEETSEKRTKISNKLPSPPQTEESKVIIIKLKSPKCDQKLS